MDTNEFPNIMQRLDQLTRRVRSQETAPRLYAAGIGAGGIRVYNGGSVNVRDGGDINILEGGDTNIGDGGKINISAGGKIVSDGPAIFSGAARIMGDTEITGTLSIQKNVTFPDGKLDGSLLASQFEVRADTDRKSDLSGNYTGWRTHINSAIAVPSWANDMYTLMTGTGYISGSDPRQKRGYAIKIGLNGNKSDEGILSQYGAGDSRAGTINAIKKSDVSSDKSAYTTLEIYIPKSTGDRISCSLYSSIIFTR